MIDDVNIDAALTYARELMDAHGLADWALQVDRARRRAGITRATKKEISLSRAFLELYSREQVRQLALHEIAHALAGPGHGHGAHWRDICLAIGGDGRTLTDPEAPTPAGLWEGVCPNGHEATRHRRPSRPASCAACWPSFNRTYLFTWRNVRTGEVLP